LKAAANHQHRRFSYSGAFIWQRLRRRPRDGSFAPPNAFIYVTTATAKKRT